METMQTVKYEQDISTNNSLNRPDCMFQQDANTLFSSVNPSCFFSSTRFTDVIGYPIQDRSSLTSRQINVLSSDVFSVETKDIEEDGKVKEENSLASDAVIPVNLMRLLQDAEGDKDEIMDYLISRKPKERTTKIKIVRASKKNHPANSGVKCQVCGRKAVGFHYGADVCTGCRLFFYRHHQTDPDHSCDSKTRRACSACRLHRCREAGMSVKASKRGRYSYEKMHEYSVKIFVKGKPEPHQVAPPPADIPLDPRPAFDEIIVVASRISEAFITYTNYPPNYFESIPLLVNSYVRDIVSGKECKIPPKHERSHQMESDYDKMHFDRYTQAGTCLQNLQRFVERLPGYNRMPKNDRWAFFIRHMLPVHVISEYRAYDVQNGLEFHLKGSVTTRQQMQQHIGSEYTDQLFNVVEKLQKLNLDENERNLLKLAGFFESDSEMTLEGRSVASREQDVMIRAFDHVVRANRNNSYQATVVIGTAMQILSDIHVLLEVSGKDIEKNVHRYPAQVRMWVGETFQGSKPFIEQVSPVNIVHCKN